MSQSIKGASGRKAGEKVRSGALGAAEAAALLGVKLPTLYAYVSRGLLRSLPSEVGGRARRYLRADVEALRARGRGGAVRTAGAGAARGPLRAGPPLLASKITAVTPQGPAYRGRLATELARSGMGFEAAAELLWQGAPPAAPLRWPSPGRTPPFEEVARLLPSRAPHMTAAPLLVAAWAARDPARFDTRPRAVWARARELIRLLAAGLALPGSVVLARAAWERPGIAEVALAAFGAAESANSADARGSMNALLILLADHELNASTFAARVAASAHADLYAAVQAGLATLSGPLHGAASDQVEALLAETPRPEEAAGVIHERARRGEPIPGFGHFLYPDAEGDPRARVLLEIARRLGAGSREVARLLALVSAMQRAGRPAPNVDAAAVALRAALGLPRGAVAGLFAVGRCAGWAAHIAEQYQSGHLIRPRARYEGPAPSPEA